MKNLIIGLFLATSTLSAQSIDDTFSTKKMLKDFELFKVIRSTANSGLYKYRTKKEIDSTYQWAISEINKSKTYRDFYNIICALTDFEGSLHNDTALPNKIYKSMKSEDKGYFPFPLKQIEGKTIMNFKHKDIPLGAEIITINSKSLKKIIPNLYKYYTTDGINTTGKSVGINYNFSKYYRFHYGLHDSFQVTYIPHGTSKTKHTTIQNTSNVKYYENVKNRYSQPFDEANYTDWEENEVYSYKAIDSLTGLLAINDFAIGDNEDDPEHLKYVAFLEHTFKTIKNNKIKNLIVDVRYNGGGTDPNDLVTYSYLTQRKFKENKQAWISFIKIPFLKHININVPVFLRPFGVIKYNKEFKKDFPVKKDGRFYQDASSKDHQIRLPNKNAFTGRIFLMISPRVASAASLFAAMLTGNENTTVIGEETMGGYYGHNGHSPMSYLLPKSKIATTFSLINLEQDVPKKKNQIYNRGIIPDYTIPQTYNDFIGQTDTQMNFVLRLIEDK